MRDDHYEGALLEEIKDQNKAVLEAVGMMQDSVKRILKIDERLEKIEHEIPLIGLVTRATNDDIKLIKIRTEKLEDITDRLKDYERRLTKLETATSS